MGKGNREYKSDIFSMLMQDAKNALSVYNALNGTNYTNPDVVEIQALDKGISLSVRNLIYFTTFIYSIERGAEKLGVTVKEFENLMEKEQLFTAP